MKSNLFYSLLLVLLFIIGFIKVGDMGNDYVFADNVSIIDSMDADSYYGISYLIVNLHLDIGNLDFEKEGLFYVVNLIKKMKYYADMNIISYLSHSIDRYRALESIMSDISSVLDEATEFRIDLKNNLISLEQKNLDCENHKKITDKNFHLAFNDLNVKSMKFNFTKSLEYERCLGETRIYYNAQNKILDKLEFYYKVLEDKYAYYIRNANDIIENYSKISYELLK